MNEYVALLLSTISYLKIKNKNIDYINQNYYVSDMFNGTLHLRHDKKIKFLKDKIEPIKDYKIISYKETFKGLGCYCFKSTKNELIFAFRGTQILDIRDLWADFNILIGTNPKRIGQFEDAMDFVKANTKLDSNHKNTLYFTGHSLGGANVSFSKTFISLFSLITILFIYCSIVDCDISIFFIEI